VSPAELSPARHHPTVDQFTPRFVVRSRGIQYAAASPINRRRLRLLDQPPKAAMTGKSVLALELGVLEDVKLDVTPAGNLPLSRSLPRRREHGVPAATDRY
jgi:hypothetical protein